MTTRPASKLTPAPATPASALGAVQTAARAAIGALIADEAHGARLARAAARVQRTHRSLVQTQEDLLHQLGLASLRDYAALARQLSRLKRRARYLRDTLERLAAEVPPDAAGAAEKIGSLKISIDSTRRDD